MKKPKTLDVPIDQLTESTLNPRRTFDDRQVADLARSIEADGILQTLLVRPMKVEGRTLDGYEVLCGARRLRAASIAGLPQLPVRVRFDLDDDADALEAMITENSQRADVAPLEEADAYQSLIARGRDVAAISAKLGRSESYVRARLRLTSLCAEGRALLERELLSLTAALALAQLDEAGQRELIHDLAEERAWPWVCSGPTDTEQFLRELGEERDEGIYGSRLPATAKDIASTLRRHHRDLSKAPWSLEDAGLVASAGACTGCPKRTGAQAELFDAGTDDTCLDRGCWESKIEALWCIRRKAAEAEGVTVAEGEEADKLVAHDRLRWGSGLVGLDDTLPIHGDEDPPEGSAAHGSSHGDRITWRQVLADKELPPSARVLVRTDGGFVEAVDERAAWDAVAEELPRSAELHRPKRRARETTSAGQPFDWKAEQRKRERKQRLEGEVRRRCVGTLMHSIEHAGEIDDATIRELVSAVAQHAYGAVTWVGKRRGWDAKPNVVPGKTVAANAAGMDRAQLLALLVELVIAPRMDTFGVDPLGKSQPIRALLDHHGVDIAHHRREARAALKPKRAKKKAAKKTTKKKRATAGAAK